MDSSEWFVPYTKLQRLFMDHMCMSATAIFIYDYCLTLHLEVKLIWGSRWSYTKVLFLVVRYLTFADTFLILYNQLFPNLSEDRCKVTYPAAMWLIMMKMFLAEVILAIRTWAVWKRQRIIGMILAVVTVAHLVAQCVIMEKATRSFLYRPIPTSFKGCLVLVQVNGGDLPLNFAALTVVEAIVFTFMAASAIRAHGRGNVSELLHIINRDGLFFYVILLFMSFVNMTAIIPVPSTTPNLFQAMTPLTPLEEVLYSVLTTRIILNIRDEPHSRRREIELHTGLSVTPPAFALSTLRRHHDPPESSTSESWIRQHADEPDTPVF